MAKKTKHVRSAESIAKQKATNAAKLNLKPLAKAKKHAIPLHADRVSIYPPFPSIGEHLPANAVDRFRNMRQEVLQRAAEMLMEKLFS